MAIKFESIIAIPLGPSMSSLPQHMTLIWKNFFVRTTGWPGRSRTGFGWLDLGSSQGWWAASVATYCPIRIVEHSKTKNPNQVRDLLGHPVHGSTWKAFVNCISFKVRLNELFNKSLHGRSVASMSLWMTPCPSICQYSDMQHPAKLQINYSLYLGYKHVIFWKGLG